MKNLPNFFIVGAAKSGTTSLHNYLDKHPKISMSKIKEPQFFSRVLVSDDDPIKPVRDEKKYLELFDITEETKILGESTANYLPDPKAAYLIKKFNPDSKILITLRNPITRTYSAYYNFVKKPEKHGNFFEQVKNEIRLMKNGKKPEYMIVGNSLYYENVKRYLEIFGSKNVKIIFFEEWQRNLDKTINEILFFLGIKDSEFFLTEKIIHNKFSKKNPRNRLSKFILKNKILGGFSKNVVPKSAKSFIKEEILQKESRISLKPNEINLLTEFFKEDVIKLESLLRKKIPWSEFI